MNESHPAQVERELTHSAILSVEKERARRAEEKARGAEVEDQARKNLITARDRAQAKLDELNAELDGMYPYAQTEAQFLGNEPMRVGYETADGKIIVGEAKIEPSPQGGFQITIEDGEPMVAGTIEDGLIDVSVFEPKGAVEEVPACVGKNCWCDKNVQKAAETVETFDGPSYSKGYQDGVFDNTADQIAAQRSDEEQTKAERGYAVDAEPAPVDQGNPSCHDLAIADMAERKQNGLDVYGVTLQGGNGRDQLRDAYMESLDLTVYLRAALFERDGR